MAQLSHVKGATAVPLSDATVYGLLAGIAERFPSRPAIVFREQGVRWSWREFRAEVDAFAAGLKALGLGKGDRIGIWSPNRAEWVVTQFATAKLGVILVNINPAYRLAELEYALQVSGCRAVISAERLRSSDYLAMLQNSAPGVAGARVRHPHGHGAHRRNAERRRRAGARTHDAARARSEARPPRRDQYPVHQRHHRQPERRDADASQHRQQRALRRAWR